MENESTGYKGKKSQFGSFAATERRQGFFGGGPSETTDAESSPRETKKGFGDGPSFSSEEQEQISDPVKPNHYKIGLEPLSYIQSWNLGFELGCVVKYVSRAKHKGSEIEDLKKAAYYLQRYIEHREEQLTGVNLQKELYKKAINTLKAVTPKPI